MTTSGVTSAEFDVATIIELAGRRAGWEVEQLTAGHAIAARQLLIAILNEWSGAALIPWAAERRTITTSANVESYALPIDVIDVLTGATVEDGDTTYHLVPISREEYVLVSAAPSPVGRPVQWWFWKRSAPTLFVSPIPDKPYVITYWCVRRLQDVTASQQTIDAPMRWISAIVDRLALELFDIIPAKQRIEIMALRPSLEARAAAAEKTIKISDTEQSSWLVFG